MHAFAYALLLGMEIGMLLYSVAHGQTDGIALMVIGVALTLGAMADD